jgi:hypothetical protein
MGFRFKWYNDAKTVMRYIAEGDWNWRDYHAAVRASTFSMHNHPHSVDVLVDLRGSTRAKMPSGLAAHVRTFGKKQTPALSGRAVVIGLPHDDEIALALDADRTLLNQEGGKIHFVADEAELNALLAKWQTGQT